jgi:acyl dehydratase|tara:strand:- start:1614 stop:2069 length:456 start_codon:yes stop_codon:yes gene_type:complete
VSSDAATNFKTLNWDDIKVGDDLGSISFPITLRTLMINVAGTRDLYPIHHDREFARKNGARDIFVNTMFYEGLFGRIATDWAGPEAFLRKLRFAMKGPNCLGDTITSRGWIVKKYRQDDQNLLDLEIHLSNEVEQDATIANLTLELPQTEL